MPYKVQLASCVILDNYGNILLVHRSASKVSSREAIWELPGGEVEDYETADEVAVREISDELSITIKLTKSLGSGEFDVDETDYEFTWFQAVIVGDAPTLIGTKKYDDLAYFETEDLQSLALAPGMQLLFDKIMSGEVVLNAPGVV